jgi:hypothetical protein
MIIAIERFLSDLNALGYSPELICIGNQYFAVLKAYEIRHGRFAGITIDLGLPALPDYPRMIGQALHIKSFPIILDKCDSKPGITNIIDSPFGPEWRYWSFRFISYPQETARQLMIQINGVFTRI